MDSSTTAAIAHVVEPRKLGACLWNQVWESESTRPFGARIREKIAALATTGVTAGMKKIVRYRPRALIFELTQTAIPREITMLSGTYKITKTVVLTIAVLNSLLSSSSR